MSRLLLAVGSLLVILAAPAAAENPVFDAQGDADVAEALAEAQQVQGVCYGYSLTVSDSDTGAFAGTYSSSSAGPGTSAATAPGCPRGYVEVVATVAYTSSLSEAEDSASWRLDSTVGGGLTIGDVEQATGAGANDLLNDDRSETVLLNAVQALPGLAAERAGLPPVVLEANTEPLPEGARATDTPGSDWLRENGTALALSVLAVLAGLVALLASRRRPYDPRDPRLPRTFGPRPPSPAPVPPLDPRSTP